MSFNNFIQQGAVRYQHGYNRQTARANIDQTIGSNLTTSMQMGFTRSQQYPDNFGWFGLTREHAAANLLGRDTQGRIFYRPDITAVTGSQTTNNNPLYFATATNGRTDASRFLGSLNARYTATDWLSFESQTSIDERETQHGLAPRRRLPVDHGGRRGEPRHDVGLREQRSRRTTS